MFKDLKEYQDITKIYQDSVNISEEEREIIRIFKEENFTEEELIYVLENFDELYDSEIDLTESLLNEEELQEIRGFIKKGLQKISQSPLVKRVMGGVKNKVTTGAGGLKQRMSAAYDKNIAKGGINKLKSGVSNIKKTVVGKLEKAKPMIKKGLDTVKKLAPVGVAGAAGFIAGKMSGNDKAKAKSREEVGLKNNVVKSKTEKKPLPTTAEIRAKDKAAGGTGMSNIPSKEGNAVIDGKKLNPDFGKKIDIKKEFPDKEKEMSKRDKFNAKFIKKDKGVGFVKRGTPGAQRAENKEKAKLRAQAMAKARIEAKKKAQAEVKEEYTPYDIVLEYLLGTEQAATIEEANYVMTEMDAKTIQSIVEEQKKTLTEKPGDGYIGPKFLNIKNPVSDFINKARDTSPIGGNKRVDDTRKGSGDKTVGKKIKF